MNQDYPGPDAYLKWVTEWCEAATSAGLDTADIIESLEAARRAIDLGNQNPATEPYGASQSTMAKTHLDKAEGRLRERLPSWEESHPLPRR